MTNYCSQLLPVVSVVWKQTKLELYPELNHFAELMLVKAKKYRPGNQKKNGGLIFHRCLLLNFPGQDLICVKAAALPKPV